MAFLWEVEVVGRGWEGMLNSSSALLVRCILDISICSWDPLFTLSHLPLCQGWTSWIYSFPLSIPVGFGPWGVQRKREEVQAFMSLAFSQWGCLGWLCQSLLLSQWSAPNNTSFPGSDNHTPCLPPPPQEPMLLLLTPRSQTIPLVSIIPHQLPCK